jgi:hypothetical protein
MPFSLGFDPPPPPEVDDLPDDIIRLVLRCERLRLIDIMSVACSSKRMYRLAREASLELGFWTTLRIR